MSVQNISLPLLAQTLARQQVTLVIDGRLDVATVSVDVVEMPVEEFLGLVGRRVSAQVSRVGSAWYVGDLRPEDRATLVYHVNRLSIEQARSVSASVGSEVNKTEALPDGLVLVSDRAEVIERIRAAFDAVNNQTSETFFVQLVVCESSGKVALDLLSVARIGHHGALVDGGLSGLRVVTAPGLLVSEGIQGKLQAGLTIPVPQKSVSDQGTVTTKDYKTVETGFLMDVTVRRSSSTACSCVLSVSSGEVVGYVDSAPIEQKSAFATTVEVADGVPLVVGCLKKTSKSFSFFWRSKTGAAVSAADYVCFLRVVSADVAAAGGLLK